MKFIPVNANTKPKKQDPLKRFPDRLSSIATRCTSGNWDLNSISRDTKKILKNKNNKTLFLDSGGYQLIKNDIKPNRFREWIDTYHTVMEYNHKDIDKIFSLDVNGNISPEKMLELNDYSIKESQKLLKKYPDLKDKQLFVIQSRTPELLDIWTELMQVNEVHESHDHYALGGLVGLRTKINHIVPMTMWLIDYLKGHGKKPKSLHYLGQSSLLVMILASWFEKEYGIEITMDSSSIFRPQSPKAVMPVLYQGNLIESIDELRTKEIVTSNPLSSFDIQEMTAINLASYQKLANELPHEINTWTEKDFKKYHPIFNQGRIAQRLEEHFEEVTKTKKDNNDESNRN